MTHGADERDVAGTMQGLRSSGLKMAEYARREDLMRTARIDGWRRASLRAVVRFCHAVREGDHVDEATAGVQFARVVAVSDAPAVRSAVLLATGIDQRSSRGTRDRRRSATRRGNPIMPGTARVIRPRLRRRCFVCVAPTDLRKQAASLALLVNRA